MLRFRVYDDNGPARSWPLISAHLLGPEDVAVRGEITFVDGEIVCAARGNDPYALALQYDAGPLGILVLQTCLLARSEKPYVLSLELARHRIKQFIMKSEEWQMFELSSEHPATMLWEEARRQFTLGLNARDPVTMDRAGRESLGKAVEATERLAMAHADVLLHRRYAAKPASSTTLGVRVTPGVMPDKFPQDMLREIDVFYVPLNWRSLEPAEGRYAWDATDRWIAWAVNNQKRVVAGPLIDFASSAIPDWMHVWQHDYDTCRDMVYDHVDRVVNRYQQHVAIWNIASGININDNFQFSPTQMMDLIRMANLFVRQRRGRTMLELAQPFGEHAGTFRDSVPPFVFVDQLLQQGIRLDCLGVQLVFGRPDRGRAMRDIMQLGTLLDRFNLLELPVLLTRVGIPSSGSAREGGTWHGELSPQMQSGWVSKVFGLSMSRPYVDSFFWGELADHKGMEIPGLGLFNEAGQVKPALRKLLDMRRRLRKPLGPLKLPSRVGTPQG